MSSGSTLSSVASISSDVMRVPLNGSPTSLKRHAVETGDLTSLKRCAEGSSDMPTTPSKHRKPSSTGYMKDTKTKNAQLVEETRSYLDEIFEAEDELEADTSEQSGIVRSNMFDLRHADKRLTSHTTSVLLNVLRRASNASQLGHIELDTLARLLKILTRSITTADANRLRALEEDVSDENAKLWLQHVDAAHNAMLSSLCVLEILLSGREGKQISFEETLLSMIDTARSVFEDLFLRWFRLPSSKLGSAGQHKSILSQLLSTNVQFLQHAARLLASSDVPENVLSRIEFMAIAIIFTEAPPKDHPTCSVSTVEALKLNSMAVLQAIFVKFTAQRRFILEEVLTSLNKLSTARSGARQYKLSDGRSIQLASALLLHLVQASAVIGPEQQEAFKLQRTPSKVKQEGEDDAEGILQDASGISAALYTFVDRLRAATMTASFIVNFLTSKTLKSTKAINTEDSSLRALLESFIEDFLAVLVMPEWPAAEILLRLMTRQMIAMVDDSKSGAQIKSFALDNLCAIAKRTRELNMSLEASLPEKHSAFDAALLALPRNAITSNTTRDQLDQMVVAQRSLLAHLTKIRQQDVNFASALELSLATFIANLAGTISRVEDARLQRDLTQVTSGLAETYATDDPLVWCEDAAEEMPSSSRKRACATLLTFYGLMHMFDAILPRMLSVMDHAQPTLRTKALRSLGSLSSIDPTILSLKIVQAQVNMRLSDVSPQVRDAALDLLGKYIIADAGLGEVYLGVLSDRLCDTGIAVRKRVIKLLREIYTHTDKAELRADITQQYLLRLRDEEDSVRDLAIKVTTELWFSWPLSELSERSNDFEALPIVFRQRVEGTAKVLGILAASEQDAMPELLIELLNVYSEIDAKERWQQPKYLLGFLTQAMLAEVLHGKDMRSRLQQLLALKVVLTAVPTLMTISQVESMKPLLQYNAGEFERICASHVASIYAKVIPRQASHSTVFLGEVQGLLLEQLTKLPTKTLNQVVPCLCEVVRLRSDYRRIMLTVKSCLTKLVNLRGQVEPKTVKAAVLLLSLLGLFGRYLVIKDTDVLQTTFPNISTEEGFVHTILEAVISFCTPEQVVSPTECLKAAVRAFSNICISYPRHFQDAAVLAVMDQIMQSPSAELKRLLVGVFQEFLANESSKAESRKAKSTAKGTKKKAANIDVEVLIGTTQKSATDGVSPGLMQRYMKDILKAAMGSDTTLAFVALDVLGKIVLQGLANPRDCVPTVIALETSANMQLRDLALQIHTTINEKHESLIDSCYLDGVRAAFQYRAHHPPSTSDDLQALLEPMYSVVRSSRQARKKLLMGITRVFDVNLDKVQHVNEADVQYAAFIAEQVLRLHYSTNEEVHFLIFGLDRIASSTTVAFMQLIDGEEGETTTSSDLTEAHHRGAAILALGLSLRNQLRQAYNLSDIKCCAFDPQKLGRQADVKTAVKLPHVSLSLNTKAYLDPAADRIAFLRSIFGQVERKIESDDEHDEPGDTQVAQMSTDAAI
jgi:hypothetical protein